MDEHPLGDHDGEPDHDADLAALGDAADIAAAVAGETSEPPTTIDDDDAGPGWVDEPAALEDEVEYSVDPVEVRPEPDLPAHEQRDPIALPDPEVPKGPAAPAAVAPRAPVVSERADDLPGLGPQESVADSDDIALPARDRAPEPDAPAAETPSDVEPPEPENDVETEDVAPPEPRAPLEEFPIENAPASNGSWPVETVAAALAMTGGTAALATALRRRRRGTESLGPAHTVGLLEDAGADARLEHGDLGVLEAALADGDVVVVTRAATGATEPPAPLRVLELDRAAGFVSFLVANGGATREYSMALGAFVDCWADTSGQMLVVEHDVARTIILPVTVGAVMLRAVERSG